METKVVNKKFAKKKDYLNVIKTIEAEGICPFCPDNFKYHKKGILKKQDGWFITKNHWPYENTRHHFLIIGMEHKECLSELTNEDFQSVKELADWAVEKFKIRGGAFILRFGDSDFSGSTVCHIHFHLMSPKRKKSGGVETVNFPVG